MLDPSSGIWAVKIPAFSLISSAAAAGLEEDPAMSAVAMSPMSAVLFMAASLFSKLRTARNVMTLRHPG
jgi:hypothetical protein